MIIYLCYALLNFVSLWRILLTAIGLDLLFCKTLWKAKHLAYAIQTSVQD